MSRVRLVIALLMSVHWQCSVQQLLYHDHRDQHADHHHQKQKEQLQPGNQQQQQQHQQQQQQQQQQPQQQQHQQPQMHEQQLQKQRKHQQEQQQKPSQLPIQYAVWSEVREMGHPGVDLSAAGHMSARTKRDAMKSNATGYQSTALPRHMMSTGEHDTINTRKTTSSMNVGEVTLLHESTRRDTATESSANPTAIDETITEESNNQPTTRPDVLSDYMSFRIGEVIKIYALPPIAVVGIVGNTISMLVMFQRENRRTSFGIYVGVLAISDTLVLCTKLTNWAVRVSLSNPLRDVDCKMMAYLVNALNMNGYFIILGFTFDRLMAVRYPLKALYWCTARRAKIVSGTAFVVAFVVNVPFVVFNHVENKVCAMGAPGSVASVVYPLLAVFVGLVVPLLSLTCMNAVIIMGIRQRLRFRSTYAPDGSGSAVEATEMSDAVACSSQDPQQNQPVTSSSKDPSQNQPVACSQDPPPQIQTRSKSQIRSKPMSLKDRNAIVTLLVISVAFLLLVAPYYVRIALFAMTNRTRTTSVNADYMLLFHVSQKLYYTNNAVNFFLYCVSGTKFRNDLARLFRGKSG